MKLYRITTKPNLFAGPWNGKKTGVLHFAKGSRVIEFAYYGSINNYFYLWEIDFKKKAFKDPMSDFEVILPLEIVKTGKILRVKKVYIYKCYYNYNYNKTYGQKISFYRARWELKPISRAERKRAIREFINDELEEYYNNKNGNYL